MLILVVGFGLFLDHTFNSRTTTAAGTFSYNFTITVSYTGSWNLKYYGYHITGYVFQVGDGAGLYKQASYNGTGSESIAVNLSGLNNIGLTLCAIATKLDSSNNTLTLKIITGQNSTSVPYGSAYTCNSVVP